MMLDTEIANLLERTQTIITQGLRRRIPVNEMELLSSPIAASVFELLVKQEEQKVEVRETPERV